MRRRGGGRRTWRSNACPLLGLHPVEHAKSGIDTGLRRFPVAADNAQLSVAAAEEKARSPLPPIRIVSVFAHYHRTPPPIPVAIPAFAIFTPAAAIEVITIPRGFLRPRAGCQNYKPCGQKKSFSHSDLPSKELEEEGQNFLEDILKICTLRRMG